MRLQRFPVTAIALLLLCGAVAAAPAPPATDIPTIAFEKYTLSNGLTVILSEDHRLPLVAVDLWYHVGPANESAGRTGFAHLFEHMMFQGSKHVPGDQHIQLLEGAGASDVNGTTDFDRTNYFETVPSNQLELALWLESDRMGYLPDELTASALANQQDVVRNERRESVENEPYGIVEEAMFHTLFPKGHPYYADVIGSHQDIQSARLADVRNFFAQYYTPNNASLAIVGDIDPARTKALVQRYFGTLTQGPKVPAVTAVTPPIHGERRVTVTDTVELPKVYVAWLTPPIFTDEDANADVLSDVLGGGKSSRLYRSLVYEQQVAQSATASEYSRKLTSVFVIEAVARPGRTAEEIEKAVVTEVEKLRTLGPDAAEVQRAKNGIETRLVNGLQRLGGFGGVADRLNTYEHYEGDPGYLERDLARYRAVTPATVKAFAEKYLVGDARVVVFGVPGEKKLPPDVPKPEAPPADTGRGEGLNPDQAWRTTRPSPGPEPTLVLPTPTQFTLSNGLTVLFARRPGIPVVAANLVVRTGSDANPPDRPGLANFTAAMLDEGTTTRTAPQIADAVAQIGATLTTRSTMDATTVSTTALARNFPAALALLADVALRPSFPAAEVERQRASRLATLVQQGEDPQQVAQRTLMGALYGARHPYGFLEIGTEASNEALMRDDLEAFWRQNFVPNNAALIVVGDITQSDARTMIERTFGDWQPGTPSRPELGVPGTTSARLIVVDKPGAPQTQLWVGAIGASRDTPDYAAIEVMNTALGGIFSSRLNLNLREDKGYTYGAFSAFVMRKAAGPFFAVSGVRTDVTGPALKEMLHEVQGMAATPLSDDELQLARASLVQSLPGDFETDQGTAGTFGAIYVFGLGLDYWTKYPALISGVDAAAATAAAKKYLVSQRLHVVAVGDKTKILPQFDQAGLDLGTPEIVDAPMATGK